MPERDRPAARALCPSLRTRTAASGHRARVMEATAAFPGGYGDQEATERPLGLTQFPAGLALGWGSRRMAPSQRACGSGGQGPATVGHVRPSGSCQSL